MSGRLEASGTEEAAKLKGFDDFDLLLGDIMRGERATLGKSLLDVQRELKIKANYIAAIENTDPSAFETPGFIAGYVRSYARYLGLDPEWAYKTFCAEGNFAVAHGMSMDASVRRKSKPTGREKSTSNGPKPAHLRDPFTEPSVSYLPKGEAVFSGIEPRAIGSIAVLMALVVGIGYGGWAVLQEVQKVRFTPIEQTPDVLADLDPLTGAVAPDNGDVGDIASLGVADIEGFDRIYRPEALDVPVMVSRDGPISAINPDSIGVLAPERSVEPAGGNLPVAGIPAFAIPQQSARTSVDVPRLAESDLLPPSVQVVAEAAPSLSLLAVRPAWVRIRGADGTVIFEKILDAGEEFEVPLTENPATLRAGNAGSLYFAINGETYGPAGSGPDVVRELTLSPETLRQSYELADVDTDADLARFIAVAEAQSGE